MVNAKKKDTLPNEVEVISAKTDDTSSSVGNGGSTATGTSNGSSNRSASKVEAKIKKKFDATHKLQLELACPTLKSSAINLILDVEQLAGDLVRYCKIVNSYPKLTLHSPVKVLEALLEVITDSTVRNMFRGAVNDAYYTLDNATQKQFTPLMTKLKDCSPYSSSSDVINRRKLIALDSKEIPMSGHKLSSTTTPMELDAFIDSMERALETRSDWRRLLLVRVPEKQSGSSKQSFITKSVLKDFRSIPPSLLLSTSFHRTDSLHSASLAMYDSITASMTIAFRGEMRLYRDKINNEGPKLLYFILKKLTQKDSRIVADFQLSLTTLEDAFKESGYDMHMVCPIIFDRLQQYQCAGGTPNTHYSMISNILLSMHCDALTSKCREWEQAQMRVNNEKNIFDLLQKLPMMVSSLISDGSWPYKSSSSSKDFKTIFKAMQSAAEANNVTTTVSKSDLTAFKAQMEALVQQSQSKAATIACKAMIAHHNANKSKSTSNTKPNPSIPPTKKRMTHRFGPDKWGPELLYKTKEQFSEFYNARIPGMDLKKKYSYVGLTWVHCAKCERMGNHLTAEHRDSKKLTGNKRKSQDTLEAPAIPPTEEAHIAPVDIDIDSSGSGELVDDFDAEAFLNVSNLLDDEDKI